MADKQELVSIVVPVRDGASSIGETLASAASQTYSRIEIVVVDDG
jgi:glycosyltransferase involved in cell wall biosynthesis